MAPPHGLVPTLVARMRAEQLIGAELDDEHSRVYLSPVDPLEVIARELCPHGPRTPREIAAQIGFRAEAADLPEASPMLVLDRDRVILYRPDARAERSILEGAAGMALRQRGARATPADVAALAARLSRPAAVRPITARFG